MTIISEDDLNSATDDITEIDSLVQEITDELSIVSHLAEPMSTYINIHDKVDEAIERLQCLKSKFNVGT